jgi:uncharacterized membrane protein
MMDFFKALEASGFGTWVRTSTSLFAFPGILFCHTLGMALIAGVSGLISIRVLGVAPTLPLEAMESLYPYMWAGFCLNAISGVMLFIPAASTKGISPVFYTKMAFIALAIVLMNVIRSRVLRNPALSKGALGLNVKILAWAALLCWLGAITSGRLLAYVGPGTDSAL